MHEQSFWSLCCSSRTSRSALSLFRIPPSVCGVPLRWSTHAAHRAGGPSQAPLLGHVVATWRASLGRLVWRPPRSLLTGDMYTCHRRCRQRAADKSRIQVHGAPVEAVHSGRWGSSLDVRGTFHVVPLRRPGAFKEGCSMRHETFFNGLPDSVAQGAQPASRLAGGKAKTPQTCFRGRIKAVEIATSPARPTSTPGVGWW